MLEELKVVPCHTCLSPRAPLVEQALAIQPLHVNPIVEEHCIFVVGSVVGVGPAITNPTLFDVPAVLVLFSVWVGASGSTVWCKSPSTGRWLWSIAQQGGGRVQADATACTEGTRSWGSTGSCSQSFSDVVDPLLAGHRYAVLVDGLTDVASYLRFVWIHFRYARPVCQSVRGMANWWQGAPCTT
jgi:hypothetical protein